MIQVVASAIVFNSEHKLLVSEKLVGSCKGQFVPPGGKVNEFESLIDGALRELKEETGLSQKYGFLERIDEVLIPDVLHIMHANVVVPVSDLKPILPEDLRSKHSEWLWVDPVDLINGIACLSLKKYLRRYLGETI